MLLKLSSTKFNENPFSHSRVVTLNGQTDIILPSSNLLWTWQREGKLSPMSKHFDMKACRRSGDKVPRILHLQFRRKWALSFASCHVTNGYPLDRRQCGPQCKSEQLVAKIKSPVRATRRPHSQSTVSHCKFYFTALSFCMECFILYLHVRMV
jgi:hypothetical protein